MKITLTIDNRIVRIDGADLKTIRKIDSICSYRVAGYYFSPAYKSRRWDGKEHLFKFSKSKGYHVPSGMIDDVVAVLKKLKKKYSVIFKTSLKSDRLSFQWNPNIKLRGYQKEAVKRMFATPFPGRGVLKMPIRSGKSLRCNEPVLTPSGWVEIQNLKIGDKVIGSHGNQINVTGVFPQGKIDIYEVRFDDGSKSYCSIDHLWTFGVLKRKSAYSKRFFEYTTKPLSEWINEPLIDSSGMYRIRLPLITKPVEFVNCNVPIDPYTLGVLIGDGTLSSSPVLTIGNDDLDIIKNIRVPNEIDIKSNKSKKNNCTRFYLTKPGSKKNPLVIELEKLGLWNILSKNKFIPKQYLYSSKNNRLSLLQGLLDTDGGNVRGCANFSTSSECLANNIVQLTQSLGGIGSKYIASKNRTNEWRVFIKLPHGINLFRCKRKLLKQLKYNKSRNHDPVRRLISIKRIKKHNCVCISVDSDDGLFVTRDMVLTHNTKTAAKIIHKINRPSIFVVPSKWLLYQTQKSLSECFPYEKIGVIGDGLYLPRNITVATIQTLSMMAPLRGTKKKKGRKADPRYFDLMSQFDAAIFDESHHIRGDGDWYRVFLDLQARYKIGISATVFFDNEKEQESGIIWLRGTCGPVKCDIPASRLIREGYLLPQHVMMYRVKEPIQASSSRYSATLKKECITENKHRNKMIAEIVKKQLPKKTIIIAREHAHINAICKELEQFDIQFITLTGLDKQSTRDNVVRLLIDGDIDVIIGNVLGEGVDIPDVECVVNAEGGKDEKSVWQRQRNLTVVEGSKKSPVMIDFFDDMSKYFRKHSKDRLKVYKSEEEFKVEVLDWY